LIKSLTSRLDLAIRLQQWPDPTPCHGINQGKETKAWGMITSNCERYFPFFVAFDYFFDCDQDRIARNLATLEELGVTSLVRELRYGPNSSSKAKSCKRRRRSRARAESESSGSKYDSDSDAAHHSSRSPQSSSASRRRRSRAVQSKSIDDNSTESDSQDSSEESEDHSEDGSPSIDNQNHSQSGPLDYKGDSEFKRRYDRLCVQVEANLETIGNIDLMRYLSNYLRERRVLRKRSTPEISKVYFYNSKIN